MENVDSRRDPPKARDEAYAKQHEGHAEDQAEQPRTAWVGSTGPSGFKWRAGMSLACGGLAKTAPVVHRRARREAVGCCYFHLAMFCLTRPIAQQDPP
ncbi:hypothetical protein GCM10027162_59730 [Streptomyces incanus]